MSLKGRLSAIGHFGRAPLGSGAMAQIDSILYQLALAYLMFMILASNATQDTLEEEGKKKTRILCIPRLAEKLQLASQFLALHSNENTVIQSSMGFPQRETSF